MNGKIILISENNFYLKSVQEKFGLLRQQDEINIISSKNIKKIPKTSSIILINQQEYEKTEILKAIDVLKKINSDFEIIIIMSDDNEEFLLNCYDKGIYNHIRTEAGKHDYILTMKNCLKYQNLKEQKQISDYFVNTENSINSKNGLFTRKALKECFFDMSENENVKNGTFIIATLEDSTKTKVSMSRLAMLLKKELRSTDICACGTGKFYLILQNTDLSGSKTVLHKLESIMGEDFKIRAGICKIGINNYESVENNANDSLKSAILNNETGVCLGENLELNNSWLDENGKNHQFKLFKKSFNNKLNKIIKPVFFKFERNCTTLFETMIVQYANDIESVFSLKNNKIQSELIIRYNGFAKLNIKISHSGLDTPDTTSEDIPLNKFDEKLLNKYLKQLVQEYKEGTNA